MGRPRSGKTGVYVLHERTPAKLAAEEEQRSILPSLSSINATGVTPGIIFVSIDTNLDGLLSVEESYAWLLTLRAGGGFIFKGALLREQDVVTIFNKTGFVHQTVAIS